MLRAGWINIYSLALALNGMPPADSMAFAHDKHTSIQCRHLHTMGGMMTPQMGHAPSWVYSSETIASDGMCGLISRHRARIHEMMAGSRGRVDSLVEGFEGNGVLSLATTNLPVDLYLRLRVDYIRCPYCYARSRTIGPIGQGQLMCCTCWEPIIWRTPYGEETSRRTSSSQRSHRSPGRSRCELAERYEERINRAGDDYRTGSSSRSTHEQRWDAGTAVLMDRNAPLHYRT
jgi:hypothetical protein